MNVDRMILYNYISSFEGLLDYDLAAKWVILGRNGFFVVKG